jgi:hypothetical protein
MAYFTFRPAKGNMNQGFGPRPKPTPTSPAIHYGQDYGWGGGDAIYAARGGRVKSYGYVGAYGNRLVIDHGGGWETWYCHTSSKTVPVGTNVAAGQQIAWMGATGNVTAKHLHFELRVNGAARDPEPYFASSDTSGGGTTPIPTPTPEEEDDMFSQSDRDKLNWTHGMLAYGGSIGGKTFNYGVLPIVAHNQTLIAEIKGQNAAMAKAIASIGMGQIDMEAIEQAAREGAAEAAKLDEADKQFIAETVAKAVIDSLDGAAGLTKEDVVEAIRSVAWVQSDTP